MKKEDKEVLKKAFNQFCDLKKYTIERDSSKQLYLDNRTIGYDFDIKEKIEDFLFKERMNKSHLLGKLFEFSRFLIEDKQYEYLTVKFLIEKSPSIEHKNYTNLTIDYLDFLSTYPDKLLEYSMRLPFIKNNRNRMHIFFEKDYFSEEQKETIIEMYVNEKEINNLNYKRIIYNLVQEHIVDKDRFNEYFTDFLKKNDNNLVVYAKQQQIYSLILNINDLIKFSPASTRNDIREYIYKIPELKEHYESLEVEKIIYNNKSTNKILSYQADEGELFELSWIGEKLNPALAVEFINNYMKGLLSNEKVRQSFVTNKLNSPKDSNFNIFVQECIITARAKVLDDKIGYMDKKLPIKLLKI